MKKLIFIPLFTLYLSNVMAQLPRPMASPQGKVEQKVGLTDISISYYRPSKNNREIFGKVVPYGELWRTGANENTKITISDPVAFGKDTLKTGTYAIFTNPSAEEWKIYFYTETTNWGTPEIWDENKVAVSLTGKVTALNDITETFTINVDPLTTNSAVLNFTWDKTRVSIPFSVPTAIKMNANIDKLMAGPTANEYYTAAEFYFKEKKDLDKALLWVNNAVAVRTNAYWMFRLKAQIQAELGDYKGAIETAKKSIELAEKEADEAFVDQNKASIEEWKKKK